MSIQLGNTQVQIEDIAAIACLNAKVSLDSSSMSEVRRSANTAKSSKLQPSEADVAAATVFSSDAIRKLNMYESRAALLAKLVQILRGRSGIRGEVAEYMEALLNGDNMVPEFLVSESEVGINTEMLGVEGAPNLGSLKEAMSIKGMLASPGVIAVNIVAIRNLLTIVDAVASLTVEAVKGFDTPFNDLHSDRSRAHNGQCKSAERVRMMLTDSRNLKKAGPKDLQNSNSIRCIPQLHGPAIDTSDAARVTIRIELNSAPAGPVDNFSATGGAFNPAVVVVTANKLVAALMPVLVNISKRITLIAETCKSPETEAFNVAAKEIIGKVCAAPLEMAKYVTCVNTTDAMSSTLVLSDVVVLFQKLVALESSSAARVLLIRQAEMLKADEEAEKIKAAKAAEMAAKFGGGDGKGKKKKKKKEKKVKQKGLVLGLGTKEFLVWLNDRVPALSTTDTAGYTTAGYTTAVVNAIQLVLNPYSRDLVDGPAPFITSLIKRIASGGVKRKPVIAKGARDFMPAQMEVRCKAFDIIRSVFSRHGAKEIDTPVFETYSTLMDKYGEDQKLIYELADQGGERLALRYDLTVPFARFLATNPVGNIKRYHISKVYRRDQPQMKRGRFREFYQCDYDVAGDYDRMVPDAEVLCVGCEILNELPIGDFKIKLNHRQLLDSMLDICGVPESKFRTICSAIDKLDKMDWEGVKAEMVDEKGLDPIVADKIGRFVVLMGEPMELYEKLVAEADQWFGKHEIANKALEDLRLLFTYLKAMGQLHRIEFNLSLARGLDYYTGVIYEAVCITENQVGSIAAGGRYDHLVGQFSDAEVPCVGISIGVERVFAIMEDLLLEDKTNLLKTNPVEVMVLSTDKLMTERMEFCAMLWKARISSTFVYSENKKLRKQLDEANKEGVRWAIIFGGDELAKNVVNVKDLLNRVEQEVNLNDLIPTLIAMGVKQDLLIDLLPSSRNTSTTKPPSLLNVEAADMAAAKVETVTDATVEEKSA